MQCVFLRMLTKDVHAINIRMWRKPICPTARKAFASCLEQECKGFLFLLSDRYTAKQALCDLIVFSDSPSWFSLVLLSAGPFRFRLSPHPCSAFLSPLSHPPWWCPIGWGCPPRRNNSPRGFWCFCKLAVRQHARPTAIPISSRHTQSYPHVASSSLTCLHRGGEK